MSFGKYHGANKLNKKLYFILRGGTITVFPASYTGRTKQVEKVLILAGYGGRKHSFEEMCEELPL
jgi:hypothetical protein